ncbi:M48 family metallopeptidase [Anaerobacillus sp. CMMVII]|uniref:M48 family metallopeptidase n=1 Tax=Anaerobacillus sp. CMMVII TaxID=2755588 RepID=UPI0021B72A55|nr:M48 family metallopeptidase [Anaerobacillus sp. CMMVII]MCT8137887.1 M48 family metallopeptidase [Anaerobacillus sp. CMMVII]
MKKVFFSILIMYLLYVLGISAYLFMVDTPLPAEYIGSEADPVTFMNQEQLTLATEYSKWRNVIYFIHTPMEWLIYLLVICFGISQFFARWSQQVSRFRFIQTALYVLLLSIISYIIVFPIKFFSYSLSKHYGITIQGFESWMKDNLIGFWVEALLLSVVVYVIMLLLSKSPKKWWLYAWLLSIPFTLFLMFIQPVLIDPLYNDFYPIQDKELEQEILQLAAEADIPAERVYEVNMSEKTNALNAYVTGVGSNLRIVLWDTTLERLSNEEVLFIMAHEMGHYDLGHLKQLLVGMIALSFVGLFLTSKFYHVIINNFGKQLQLKHNELGSLPILLLILSLLSFAASPMSNVISRAYEYQADRYAIELTKDADAAITTFHKLSVEGLSDVNPPGIVKLFRYTHPPMVERITHIRKHSEKLNK